MLLLLLQEKTDQLKSNTFRPDDGAVSPLFYPANNTDSGSNKSLEGAAVSTTAGSTNSGAVYLGGGAVYYDPTLQVNRRLRF